jgi:hypothetical protein
MKYGVYFDEVAKSFVAALRFNSTLTLRQLDRSTDDDDAHRSQFGNCENGLHSRGELDVVTVDERDDTSNQQTGDG